MPENKPLLGDIARCEGRRDDTPGGALTATECELCKRRTSPPTSMWQPWMTPQPAPCQFRIAE